MLKDGYTYTLSVIITPSDNAKTQYATSGKYPDTPDPGTGTHADAHEKGFYSNAKDQATLSYKHSSWNETLTDKYLRPVVQVPEVGDLVINKEVTGTTVSNATYRFEIETNLNMTDASPKINGTAVSFTETEEGDSWKATVELQATTNDDGADGTITITGLPIGSYTVTEMTDATSLPTVANYHWVDVAYNGDSSKDQAEVTVGSDTEKPATVAVTNNYEHDDVTLTVTKTVGGNMGDTSPENKFDFKLTLTKDGSLYRLTSEEAEKQGLTVVNNSEEAVYYTFQLASGENKAITLSYGVTAKVEETDRPDYKELSRKYLTEAESSERGTYVEVNYQEQLLNGDYTFDFQNTRDIIAPTGLESNHTTPYTLMVTAAGIAGLALIGGIVVRRRRRRME